VELIAIPLSWCSVSGIMSCLCILETWPR
jgi:hypothetical protein